MQCSSCGQKLVPDAQFCGNCGAQILNSKPAVPPAPPTETPPPVNQTAEQTNPAKPAQSAPMPEAVPIPPVTPAAPAPTSIPAAIPPAQAVQATPGTYAIPAQPKNGLSIASLVLGIIALFMCLLWFLAVPLGILALVFGLIGRGKGSKGMAIAGIILGVLAMIISIGFVVLVLSLDSELSDPNFNQMLQ